MAPGSCSLVHAISNRYDSNYEKRSNFGDNSGAPAVDYKTHNTVGTSPHVGVNQLRPRQISGQRPIRDEAGAGRRAERTTCSGQH
jgi:hypothetical protein